MDFLGRARTFVRVVEVGSLSAAARSLGVSLAAVSRQIGSLESELGAELLARTTRSQRLTDAGRRFHEHAVRLVREADAAVTSVRGEGHVAGDLTVSASVSLGVLRVVPELPVFLGAHPELRLELRLEERAVDLVGEGVDIALRAGLTLPDATGLVALKIATFRRFVVAAPKYLRAHGTPRDVGSLTGRAAIVGTRSGSRWDLTDEHGQAHNVVVDAKLRVGTLIGIREAAVAGLGLALLPEFVVSEALEARTLRVVLPRAEVAPVAVHAIHRTEARGSPRVRAFVAHLRRTMPLSTATSKSPTPR
jgi:DNA-binding transcriptional LysR family regulator